MKSREKGKICCKTIGDAGFDRFNECVKVAVGLFREVDRGDFRLVVFLVCVSLLFASLSIGKWTNGEMVAKGRGKGSVLKEKNNLLNLIADDKALIFAFLAGYTIENNLPAPGKKEMSKI